MQFIVCNVILAVIIVASSCKKLVAIDEPINSLTTEQVFLSENTAIAAVTGIYSKLIQTKTSISFGSGIITLYSGLSSDELNTFFYPNDQFLNNSLTADNSVLSLSMWAPAYSAIFQASSCIEALNKSNSISENVKKQLLGECKFIRAFCYFYLTNFFGDVPLVTASDWKKTYLVKRTDKQIVFEQIVMDLKEAKDLLQNEYPTGNERIRANKFSASALLARVYLFMKNWTNTEAEATIVINQSSIYSLESNLNNVFLSTSKEAILQFQPSNVSFPYAIPEPRNYIPTFNLPNFYLTNSQLNTFETGDLRKLNWVKTVNFAGTTYNYPAKYKIKDGTAGSVITEYYMVLRLAEQFLIRSEARAMQNNLAGAISDLNVIRNRAAIPNLPATLSQSDVLLAIEKERQTELFAEWAHRWLDLKRTNRANAVLSLLKAPNWQITDELYPIPLIEIQRDPNLTQNTGY